MKKFRTGIAGFDQISEGGLPLDRVSLIAGGAGCGKSLFMLSALINGVIPSGSRAVFLTFEEIPDDIRENASAIGLDIDGALSSNKLVIEHIKRPTEQVAEVGAFSLDGLLMRIEAALNKIDANVIAIDTVETLFSMFEDTHTVRQELVRVFIWLKEKGVTTLVSGERGGDHIRQHDLEEYVSDCVVLLDQRVINDVATRRLRIAKYRGSSHGTNEYPFLIGSDGISVMPLPAGGLDQKVVAGDISTGLSELDNALQGGYSRASTIMVAGGSGTGKSILAGHALAASCVRGDKAAVISFEESPDVLIHNLQSAGIDLEACRAEGQLIVYSDRPVLTGLERHLLTIYQLVETHAPKLVVIDPVSGLTSAGEMDEVYRTLIRLVDYLKRSQVTALLTMESTRRAARYDALKLSSVIDIIIELSQGVASDNFRRELRIVKKRGSSHKHFPIPFRITSSGIQLEDGDDD